MSDFISGVENFYRRVSDFLFASPIVSCVSTPEETCTATGGLPQVGASRRNFEGLYDISDPSRPEVTWEIFDIANCDGSIEGISVSVSFGDEGEGKVELIEAENGTLTARISHRFNSELQGPFPVIIKGKNGKEKRVDIYPPYYKTPEPQIPSACDYNPSPSIHGTIQMNPTEVYVGDTITFWIPKSQIAQCDGITGDREHNSLKVGFIIESNYLPAGTGNPETYSTTYPFAHSGNQKVFLKVVDTSHPNGVAQYTSIEFWVHDTSSSNLPSAAISGPYAAHQGDTVSLTGNSDDPEAAYRWTITPPTGPIQSFEGKEISLLVDQVGRYDVRLTVTASDGISQRVALHSIDVYPPEVEIPTISISAPYSAEVNETVLVSIIAPNLDDFDYTLSWGDGTESSGGPTFSHTYSATGTYMIKATASRKDDPSIKNSINQNISIVPTEVEVPRVAIQAPFFAEVGTPVTFMVPNPTPSATYYWDFGDGESASGPSTFHTYSAIGEYQVRLTGELGGVSNTITHNITIGNTPVPIPVLVANHDSSCDLDGDGVCGYRIIFDASRSYSPTAGVTVNNFQITFGDGSSESNSSGIFYHNYPNPTAGGSATYNAYLVITDSSGQNNATYVPVSVWGEYPRK